MEEEEEERRRRFQAQKQQRGLATCTGEVQVPELWKVFRFKAIQGLKVIVAV